MMCRPSEVTLTVTGRSAHVARAGLGRDALEAAARWYLEALSLERQLPPEEPPAFEIRPSSGGDGAHRPGGLRPAGGDPAGLQGPGVLTGSEGGSWRPLARDVAAGSGCRLDLSFSDGYPAVWRIRRSSWSGWRGIWPLAWLDKPVLITEDFSWYQRYLPGLFFFLGCGPAPALHGRTFSLTKGCWPGGRTSLPRWGGIGMTELSHNLRGLA